MGEATYNKDAAVKKFVATATADSGEIQQLEDGRACFITGLVAVAIGDTQGMQDRGIVAVDTAAATTFAKGDEVVWDASASLAVAKGLTMNGDADFRLGICVETCTNTQTKVQVDLNATAPGNGAPLEPVVFEFDCQTGVDATAHVLIPAEQNPNGLVITHSFGLVTEVFAGDGEDQGVITISDESNNAICTLTPTNAGADAIADYILGVQAQSTATGAATILQVAAGEYVDAAVTTPTSGAGAAGKMKVYIEAIPLV
jgi:predicted RecA/RadA family phage recombinase